MIYIYGNGGRGKLIKELLLRLKIKYKDITFIDDYKKKFKNKSFLIKNFNNKKDKLYIAITSPKIQKKKYSFLKLKLKFIDNNPLIDPSVILKSNSDIGKNCIILENTSIGPDVKINKNTFIGTAVIVNHDCKIGKFTTISHGVNLSGNVKVGDNCYVGSSSSIKQKIKINNNTTIGIGSNIVKNCESDSTYFGNPGIKIK